MAKVRDPDRQGDDDLQRVLEEGAEAAAHDPDEADIAADDAGGTRLAEALEEAQAHPS
jgi:hypothetical protein